MKVLDNKGAKKAWIWLANLDCGHDSGIVYADTKDQALHTVEDFLVNSARWIILKLQVWPASEEHQITAVSDPDHKWKELYHGPAETAAEDNSGD